jgi:hypothetical protein
VADRDPLRRLTGALPQRRPRLDAEADRLEDAADGQGEAAEERAEAAIEAREDALDASDDEAASAALSDVVTGNASGDGFSLAELHVGLLLVVPATGLLLVVAGNDWVPVHVAAQLAFLGTVAVHVGFVLRHTVVHRNRHLARML